MKKTKRKRKVFLDTLKKSLPAALGIFLCFSGSLAVFYLYALPPEPFLLVFLFVSFFGIICFFAAYERELAKANARERMMRAALTERSLPPASTLAEEDCHEVINILKDELTRLVGEYENERQNEIDYYTAWVHQIKTPISVMRMELSDCSAENAQKLEAELFRIEQYVDMVLSYIRLGNDSSDLVIKEYPLDELIREAVRKFAPQFVAKKLKLDYAGTDMKAVTDKKWFLCCFEQILSNAIKYTPYGSITISEKDGILKISDTGIGIAAEDIPRIFEKGFTGENGRIDKKSSGLGLYLCKKAADMLKIPLSAESTVGKGSCFSLDLRNKQT